MDLMRDILAICLSLLLIVGMTFAMSDNSPEFKITKEVCYNESEFCHGVICTYDIFEQKDVEITYEFQKDQMPSGDTYQILYEDGEKVYPNECYEFNQNPCGKDKICKDIEFDEINTKKDCSKWNEKLTKLSEEINKNITSSDSYGQHLENMNNAILSSKIFQKGINCLSYNRFDSLNISKEDLTKEWLKENCKLEQEDNYRCGDYTVEVLK